MSHVWQGSKHTPAVSYNTMILNHNCFDIPDISSDIPLPYFEVGLLTSKKTSVICIDESALKMICIDILIVLNLVYNKKKLQNFRLLILRYDVINFEINPIFLIKPFSNMTKKSRQKLKYLENGESF